jgi:hypothetical protein
MGVGKTVKARRAVCRDGEGKVVVCSEHAKGNVFS